MDLFTIAKRLCCCCLCGHDQELNDSNDEESEHFTDVFYDSDTDSISRLLPDPTMTRKKVYGKKVAASGAATFFIGPSPSSSPSPPTSSSPAARRPIVAANSPRRHPLEDVINAFGKVRLDDDENVKSKEVASKATRATRSAVEAPLEITKDTHKWLQPLVVAFEKMGRHDLKVQKWSDLLLEDWELTKIAESSYAEVYKVTNEDGTSIIKLMALKPPNGPGSQRETSLPVESVISELLIMDRMADTTRFLEFKDAHVIEGKPPKSIIKAYGAHAAEKESFFPKPQSYHKSQLFLALELGDAGTDIEHFPITTIEQVWDIFLGVTIALATGETTSNFEHRDLHEGNVCVKQIKQPKALIDTAPHRYGYSGLEVTILDYTLSRVGDGADTVYLDLEDDLALFQQGMVDEPLGLLQHEMYERMRNWLFFRAHREGFKELNTWARTPLSDGHVFSWKDYVPYTNVIWLYYVLDFVQKEFKGPAEDLEWFKEETADLQARIDPDVKALSGGFTDAVTVYNYAIESGWLNENDADDVDDSTTTDND